MLSSLVVSLSEDSWIEKALVPLNVRESWNNLYETLWEIKPEYRHVIRINGEPTKVRRYQQAFGQDYEYSGTTNKGLPFPQCTLPILEYFSELYKVNFNMLLINWYECGDDYISAHHDDASKMYPDSPIITFSLGTDRIFGSVKMVKK